MAGFFTREDFASFVQQDVDNATTDLLIAASAQTIREEIRQLIDFVSGDTVTIRSQGGFTMLLPERPVTAVTSVSVAATALGAGEIEYESDTGALRWVWRAATALFEAVYRPFPCGAEVTVVYSHGYALIPESIKALAMEISATAYVNPSQVLSETLRDYSVTYANQSTGGGAQMGRLILNDEQRRRLDPFRGPLI